MDIISRLPTEMVDEIASHLDYQTLSTLKGVSRGFKRNSDFTIEKKLDDEMERGKTLIFAECYTKFVNFAMINFSFYAKYRTLGYLYCLKEKLIIAKLTNF